MKPEEQHIAIAEALGLFQIMPLRRTTQKGKEDPNGVVLWYCESHHGGYAKYSKLPNFLGDLNATHEMEKSIFETYDRSKWTSYVCHLQNACCCGGNATHNDHIHATSSQRCEAFLRTLGLWKEDKE